MGRAFGTGSPLWFLCAQQRRDRVWPDPYPEGHTVTRTGRTRARRGNRAIGTRQLHTSHEYRCTCGYTGWTTHSGVLNRPVITDPSQLPSNTRESE